jgi:hypothetical protein
MEMRNISVHRDQSRSFAGGRRRGGNVSTLPGCKRAAESVRRGLENVLTIRAAATWVTFLFVIPFSATDPIGF